MSPVAACSVSSHHPSNWLLTVWRPRRVPLRLFFVFFIRLFHLAPFLLLPFVRSSCKMWFIRIYECLYSVLLPSRAAPTEHSAPQHHALGPCIVSYSSFPFLATAAGPFLKSSPFMQIPSSDCPSLLFVYHHFRLLNIRKSLHSIVKKSILNSKDRKFVHPKTTWLTGFVLSRHSAAEIRPYDRQNSSATAGVASRQQPIPWLNYSSYLTKNKR